MIFNILIKKKQEKLNPANELAIRLEQLKHVPEWDRNCKTDQWDRKMKPLLDKKTKKKGKYQI
jgi:5-hydroxyisourate hydrolase-like protein (transthyretin family)